MRIMIIQAGTRNKDSCPGIDAKTKVIAEALVKVTPKTVDLDVLDLSITDDPKRRIQPCKGCIGTAGGFHCQWQCSCYGPNSGGEKLPDIMHDEHVYDRLLKADGIYIMTPVHWWSVTTSLKAFFDRLVCASGTITKEDAIKLTDNDFKNPEKTKALESSGKYRHLKKNHLENKIAAFFVHGDDGANDYTYMPDAAPMRLEDKEYFHSDPRDAIEPIVKQLKYSGIFVPESLIFSMSRNVGHNYGDNDKTFELDKKFIKGAVDTYKKLVKYITRRNKKMKKILRKK